MTAPSSVAALRLLVLAGVFGWPEAVYRSRYYRGPAGWLRLVEVSHGEDLEDWRALLLDPGGTP